MASHGGGDDQQSRPKRHVAVCAFPFGTHAAPLLILVKRLAAAARDVRFSFLNAGKSNDQLFKANSGTDFPNIVACNLMPEDRAKSDSDHHSLKAIGVFMEAAPEAICRGVAEAEADVGVAVSCIISDAFLWFCKDIAEKNGIPWISLWTASSASLYVHVHTDDLRNKFACLRAGGKPCEDEVIADCVPGLSDIRISDLPLGVVSGDLDSPLSKMLHKMGIELVKATAVVINSFEELLPMVTNDLKSKMRCLLNVGPFCLMSPPQTDSDSDEFSCLQWMERHEPNSVAYISFGTAAAPPKEEIIALAEGLEAAKVPFIWSLNDSLKGHLPCSFLNRIESDKTLGMVMPWAPQMDLLRHSSMGVFVTHCGWNSVMESIVCGVPLICRPILGDQMLNQRLVETIFKCGVGIEGGVFTKSGTIKAFEQALSSEKGNQMRNQVKALQDLARQGAKSSENFNTLLELVTKSHDQSVTEIMRARAVCN